MTTANVEDYENKAENFYNDEPFVYSSKWENVEIHQKKLAKAWRNIMGGGVLFVVGGVLVVIVVAFIGQRQQPAFHKSYEATLTAQFYPSAPSPSPSLSPRPPPSQPTNPKILHSPGRSALPIGSGCPFSFS